MTHVLEGFLVGVFVGVLGGYFLARDAYNRASTKVAKYILAGRKNAANQGIR